MTKLFSEARKALVAGVLAALPAGYASYQVSGDLKAAVGVAAGAFAVAAYAVFRTPNTAAKTDLDLSKAPRR